MMLVLIDSAINQFVDGVSKLSAGGSFPIGNGVLAASALAGSQVALR